VVTGQQLNKMGLTTEVLFINPDYLKRLTSLNGSVEDAYIIPSVIVVQDKIIQQYLGTKLMDALLAHIKAGTLAANDEILVDDYVRKCTAWWTMVDLIPSLYVKIDNGGLVIRSAENTAPISPDDLHREVERARQNAQFYTERLVSYLCQNSGLYPEYSSNSGSEMSPKTDTYNQNGMTFSTGSAPDLLKYFL
tara:strand:- start:1238 stop:1816 length:579 start_codon:yes stop_codon:yes gene_type:complete